jgi:hypothetical protein
MRCLSCENPMVKRVGDFDYTNLAGLRGKIVILSDVSIYGCKGCGPAATYVEISRMADLHRELVAAGALLVRRLWCRFVNNEWVLVMESNGAPPRRLTKKKRADVG